MRKNYCREHFERHAATARAAAGDGAGESQLDKSTANAYELMLVKLAQDKRRLKEIQSKELKAEMKAKLLPDYQAWIEGAIAADSTRQDDVLMTVFVWAIDAGNFVLALDIGAYALRNNLVMPDQYKRDVPCVLAEEIADYALKGDESELSGQLVNLARAMALTAGKDMPDEVLAKLHKAYGYAQRADGDLPGARQTLARALELDGRVGVKKDIERLDTLIKNSPPEGEAEKSAGTESG